jgi:transmembrane sensor
MNKTNRFAQLLELYLSGNISTDEHEELFDLLSTHEYDAYLGRSIQKSLARDPSFLAADLPPHVAEEIIRHIFNSEKNAARVLPLHKPRPFRRWIIAASVVLAMGVAGYFLLSLNNKGNQNSFTSQVPANSIVHAADNAGEKVIMLEDGSKVVLQPHSRLHFAKTFNQHTREVYLEGEAFFEIAKNPRKPFLVHCNTVVARVLGTSFNVNTNAKTGEVEVAVKTGKVQVYENDTDKTETDKLHKAIILTPNQRVVYKPQNRHFETLLVEKPGPVNEETSILFTYDDEKLLNVFKHIEVRYGIEIIVENQHIYNCRFTGDVSTDDLYKKLDFICLATNASYEVNGTKILIKGNGCEN